MICSLCGISHVGPCQVWGKDPPPVRDEPFIEQLSGDVFAKGCFRAYTPPDEEEPNDTT